MAAPPKGPPGGKPPPPPKLPLYLVFNAFEEIPPPPDFSTFVEGWQYTGEYVSKNKCFLVTQLHENIDQEGKYKYINHACFDGAEFEAFSGPTKEFIEVGNKGNPPSIQKFSPGGYAELATSTGKPLAPWLQRDANSLWIITGFIVNHEEKSAEVADFEKNWRVNSGADFILNAPKELGISKVGFYKKFTPRPALDYVVRAEITGIKGDDVGPAVEFLKKLNQVQYPGCITMVDSGIYKAPPQYTGFPTAGKRDPPAGYPWIPE